MHDCSRKNGCLQSGRLSERANSTLGGSVIVEIPYLAITKHFLRSEMLDLTRFPLSDGAGIKCYTFCTILDRKRFFGFFELLVFDKRSRDHRTHGIVENSIADPMRALPSPCGTSLGSEGPTKGQKCAFGTRNHLFPEISRNYENSNSKKFDPESGERLSWVRCTDSG